MGPFGVPEVVPLKLAVIWVHYRTPHLLADAVRSVSSQAAGLGLEVRQGVVDQSAEPGNNELWGPLGVECWVPKQNLGYAGGINHGLDQLGEFEVALVANPDTRLLEGALAPLLAGIDAGAAAAGPRFFWDPNARWALPPTEERRLLPELLSALAPGFPRVAHLARKRWRRWALRHWAATRPLLTPALSGALLAWTRAAWTRIGPFDEGYPLYFEEDDWIKRLWQAGFHSVYVPAARAWHLYGQSASGESKAAQWFEISARRFRERHYGRRQARGLERLERIAWKRSYGWKQLPARGGGLLDLARDLREGDQLEFSHRPQGFPAVRVAREGLAQPPGGFLELAQRGWIAVTAVKTSGAERWRCRWRFSSKEDRC